MVDWSCLRWPTRLPPAWSERRRTSNQGSSATTPDHAFASPSGPHYGEPAAAEAWEHVVAFLARVLGE